MSSDDAMDVTNTSLPLTRIHGRCPFHLTPAAEGHGLCPWVNAPAFGRDVAPLGREEGCHGRAMPVGLHDLFFKRL